MPEPVGAVLPDTQHAPGFHVFSIRPKAAATSPDETVDPYTSKQYITRKSHRKSRLGCTPCKSKRVKCDEQRPNCGRCQRTKTACDYTAQRVATQSQPQPRFSSKVDTGTTSDPANQSLSVIRRNVLPTPRSLEKSPRDAYLLKHYDTLTSGRQDTITCSDTIAGPKSHEYRMAILRLAQKHSYLRHAIFAAAALHLTHHEMHEYRLVKLSHLQVALTEFQTAISKPIKKEDADAILLTAMYINMQHFSWIDSTSPKDSWVFAAEPTRLDWLSVQLGLLQLVISTEEFHEDTLLAPLWKISKYDLEGTKGLPDALARLCGVYEGVSEEEALENSYYKPLLLLGPLMSMKRGSCSIVQYVVFIRSVPRNFFDLAQRNDLRALLILSYWFGLMCYVDFWWVRRRAKRDCTALCMYLEAHGDGTIHSLLEFPGQACGYELKSQKDNHILVEEGPWNINVFVGMALDEKQRRRNHNNTNGSWISKIAVAANEPVQSMQEVNRTSTTYPHVYGEILVWQAFLFAAITYLRYLREPIEAARV